MAVYTEVSFARAAELLSALQLGRLTALEGCSSGIENTNYFASTDQGDYVLTVFERLNFEQLPFYLRLMKHLAQSGVIVPEPAADASGNLVQPLHGKPAAVVNRLRGACELQPGPAHCAQVGEAMAGMHLAGQSFGMAQAHLRGLAWWNETVPQVLPHTTAAQSALLQSELAHQNALAAEPAWAALPRGPIHGDLFRDNVMFETTADGTARLSGFYDFYFAGVDTLLFDLAVAVNDWCVHLPDASTDPACSQAFLAAYNAVRPLTVHERRLLPDVLRAAALRFWISRLWDWHLPRQASMLQAHDPGRFESALRQRIAHPLTMEQLAL
jgi:homoserine kinase type II